MIADLGVRISKAQELYDATSHIVGQKKARKQMAAIFDGQWRIAQGLDEKNPGGVLVFGPSGTGKSASLRAMAQHVGLPYAETDATRYAEVGYKGLQLPQMFIPLLHAAARLKDGVEAQGHQDSVFKRDDLPEIVELAQHGVILLDEFDKWMDRINHFTGKQDTAIQGELLKLIEGSTEFVTATDDEVGVQFDTSKVLIICAGAFVRLYRVVRHRLGEEADPKMQQLDENFWNRVVPQDFEQFGLLPELTGRLSRHVVTRQLRTEDMREILTNPGGVLEYYRRRFEGCGVRWDIGDGGVLHIVAQAMKHETGARALEFVANRMLGGELLYEASVAERPLRLVLEPNMHRAELRPL